MSFDCITFPSPFSRFGGAVRAAMLLTLMLHIAVVCAKPTQTFPQDASSTPTTPLYDAYPPSTLLASGSTTLTLDLLSTAPTRCRYAVGTPLPYDAMTPFSRDEVTTVHQSVISGLNPDPLLVNEVYVRCEAQPDYLLHLRYRSIPSVNPRFPRTGNLWGSWNFIPKGMAYCSRIDLWLGASFTSAQIAQLRALNPNILILDDINTVENNGLPDDYYLRDVNGNRIEVWPGVYRLNLTKPYVADYQARYAYQRIIDSGLAVDGCFFDNFMVTQSWLTHDIHGTEIEIDADEDGVADDPQVLDAAWRAGVFRELREWRRLMPWALATGHVPASADPEVAAIFNADSIGFMTADVLDGKSAFAGAWKEYNDWFTLGRPPCITMIESSPPDQIAYGYDYDPLHKIPASTLEFARTYYPYVRFGLALTLMNDGYFAHEFGDTDHGQDWWYNELDFDLGYPTGVASRIPIDIGPNPNLVTNGGFESPLSGTWSMWVNTAVGCDAEVVRDTTQHAEGTASAHITVRNPGEGVSWHIDFYQRNRSYVAGQVYDLAFMARCAGTSHPLALSSQKGSADWRNYGLYEELVITPEWKEYVVTFEANETVGDARIQFHVGAQAGEVWIDDVRLTKHSPDVFRRDFDNGVVLLNGTKEAQTIALGAGFRHLSGEQAPRHQAILDDATSGVFSMDGGWQVATLDSGEWKDAGPFYHDWGADCHVLPDSTTGTAQWNLMLREDGTHTIQAWWPAAPGASARSKQVLYEICTTSGVVLTSATLDQSAGGDEWHTIATLPLSVADCPFVRIRNMGSGPCIADALHVFSAARLNDGSKASSVMLEPLDGLVLEREPTSGVAGSLNYE